MEPANQGARQTIVLRRIVLLPVFVAKTSALPRVAPIAVNAMMGMLVRLIIAMTRAVVWRIAVIFLFRIASLVRTEARNALPVPRIARFLGIIRALQ
jgi:hypothetical protein